MFFAVEACSRWQRKDEILRCRKLFSRPRERHHINKGYDCCRRQTDMARRYPDDDPLRRVSSHSVALTVGLSVQSYYQHEIPGQNHQQKTWPPLLSNCVCYMFTCDGTYFTSGQGSVCPSFSCYLRWSHWSAAAPLWPLWPAPMAGWHWEEQNQTGIINWYCFRMAALKLKEGLEVFIILWTLKLTTYFKFVIPSAF